MRTYTLYVNAPVHFEAYDAAGHVIAPERFAPLITVAPESATLAITLSGLAVLGAGAERRRA